MSRASGDPQSQRQPLSLAHLTVLDATAPELVSAAALAGFQAAGIRLRHPPEPGAALESIDQAVVRATASRLQAEGIEALDVEVLWIRDATPPDAWEDLCHAAASLGARYLVALSDVSDEARLVDRLAAICALADVYGLAVGLEFAVFTAVRSLAQAERIVRATGAVNAHVLVDFLHVARSGGTEQDLAQLDRALVPYVQICDAAAEVPGDVAAMRVEARTDRRYPGQGVLPLRDWLAALPPGVPLSVEAPCAAFAALDVSERARRVAAATRQVLHEGR